MSTWNVPPGFVERQFPRHTWWVKAGWEEIIPTCLHSSPSALCQLQSPSTGGRGSIYRVSVGEQGNIMVRRYQRGGAVRYFVRDVYWDRPPRPLMELISTETAQQRGVPTVEVLGAGVEWVAGGLYRGVLITREAQEFINLWEWLQCRPASEARRAMSRAVAKAVGQLHAAGIIHADLNLTNILVRTVPGTPEVLLIDFDQARLFSGLPHLRYRKQNLRRLRRSLDKFDPNGLLTTPEDVQAFCQEYSRPARP